jgi:branched-chain amino acid transport system permease protein
MTAVPGMLSPSAIDSPTGLFRVRRSARPSGWLVPVALGVVVLFAFMPALVSAGDTSLLVNVFILLTISTMWNLMAGYAGMVSIGQQAFIGLGAYAVLIGAIGGMEPFTVIPIAAIACAVIALPISFLVFRTKGGYFAVATWVVASTAELVISSITSIGGGTGRAMPGLSSLSPTQFGHITYWAALAVVVLALAVTYLLLRSRLGLVLSAVRDDEEGALAAGARVMTARRIVYLVAALGCGAAGALLAVSQLQVQPASVFSVQYSAEIIFVTLIGGMGTIEGPIIGTIVYFALQQNLSQHGAWYLIILGTVAVVIAIWLPRGLWGTVTRRLRFEFFPVGYFVVPEKAAKMPGSAGTEPEANAPVVTTDG